MLTALSFALLIIVSLAILIARRYRRPLLSNSSVLLTYFTQNAELFPGRHNLLANGAGHITFVSHERVGLLKASSAVIDVAYLPFSTDMRLLAVPTTAPEQINPTLGNSGMETVVLEGDFPSYFSLYANKGQGVQARYILDPATMAYVVDFCGKHYWELVNNELIFVTEKGMTKEEMVKFIEQIRPAIEIPADMVDPDVRREYKPAFLQQVTCPICSSTLQYEQHGFRCTNGHGSLVTGGSLMKLARSSKGYTDVDFDTDSIISCPQCGQQMVKLDYNLAYTIDSCVNCPYRWLDAGEFV